MSGPFRPKCWHLSADAYDIKEIIDYLQHHVLHVIWPEYEDNEDDEYIPDDEDAEEFAIDDEVSVQDETDDKCLKSNLGTTLRVTRSDPMALK